MLALGERQRQTLAIYRFKVEPDVLPGEYRYRLLLLTPTDRRGRDFSGRLELVVSLTGRGPECYDVFPGAGRMPERRVPAWLSSSSGGSKGTFRVNPKAKVESVQVRVFEDGSSQPRATHSVSLDGT